MADIILSNIRKCFGKKVLFNDFSLKIESGDFLAIMGESGAGKTTLLNMMGLLDTPDSGSITICGKKICPFLPMQLWNCAVAIYPICSKTTV